MRSSQRVRQVISFVAIALAAGCSAGAEGTDAHGGHGEAAPAPSGATELAITASSFAFAPTDLRVLNGEEVAVVLTSSDIVHDFTVDDVEFHVVAEAGETATAGLRIDQPGTYTAYCSVPGHREAGMETRLVVE